MSHSEPNYFSNKSTIPALNVTVGKLTPLDVTFKLYKDYYSTVI